jgi:hypothetical protein
VKEFLSREGRSFIVRNVEEDESAYSELVALGFLSVPVTLIGRSAVRGFNEAELRRALAADAGS